MVCVAPSSEASLRRDSMRSTPMIVRQLGDRVSQSAGLGEYGRGLLALGLWRP